MQTGLDRRAFLTRAAAAGGGLLSMGAIERLVARDARGAGSTAREPYGPLRRARDQHGVEVLALPAGFSYVTFGHIGAPMAARFPTRSRSTAWPRSRSAALGLGISPPDPQPRGPQPGRPAPAASPATRPVFLRRAGRRRDLDARLRPAPPPPGSPTTSASPGRRPNCAGGIDLPQAGLDQLRGGRRRARTTTDPKLVWVPAPPPRLPATGSRSTRGPGESHQLPPADPEQMGRFSHEAIAVDQRTGIVYLTEDPGAGIGAGFYRYLPRRTPTVWRRAGELQMLGVRRPAPTAGHAPRAQTVGEPLAATMVQHRRAGSRGDESSTTPPQRLPPGLRAGRRALQPARGLLVRRGLGVLRLDQRRRRPERRRQRRRLPAGLRPGVGVPPGRARRRVRDACRFESPADDVLDSPDNVTVTPPGGLLAPVRGDTTARRSPTRTRWRPGSRTSTGSSAFSRRRARRSSSRSTCLSDSEVAGVCFSPERQDDVLQPLRGAGLGGDRRPSTPGRA